MIRYKPVNSLSYKNNLNFAIAMVLLTAISFSSCTTTKTTYYFKTLQKDQVIPSNINKMEELKIRKNDLLSINISSLNRDEDLTYNAPSVSFGSGGQSGTSSGGYLVDAMGNIQLHKSGLLHAEGMTRASLKEKIQKDLAPYLKDPVVTVRYLNHRVTILGEVSKPQVVQMPEEHISLLELLGISGDVTQFARRDNILIIRETDNGKQSKRINMEDHSVLGSEWYWLQPGDVVYVEPNDKKIKDESIAKRNQTISIALSALSVAIIILNRLIK